MKAIKLICLLLAFSVNAMAQTYPQKGVVRMITTSTSSPLIPVAGVRVLVGNNVSKAIQSSAKSAEIECKTNEEA